MYTHSGVRGNEQGPKFNSIYDLHRYDTKKTCLQHLDDSKSLTAWNIYQQGIESLIYL